MRTLVLLVAGVALMSACAGPAETEVVQPQPRAPLRAVPLGTSINVLGVQPGPETLDVEVVERESVGLATAAGAGAVLLPISVP